MEREKAAKSSLRPALDKTDQPGWGHGALGQGLNSPITSADLAL
jgi:hypothetical protein